MRKVKALRNFKDLKENRNRYKNEIFEATQERIEEINSTPHGALVEEIEEEQEQEEIECEDEEVVEIDITELSVTDLKEIAKERNIKGYSSMKRDELIQSLRGD